MMYPFLTLDDGTEIVHSEMHSDGTVKVYMEKLCWLPSYRWEDISGFSQPELSRCAEVIRSTAHLILRFAQEGGFDSASNL